MSWPRPKGAWHTKELSKLEVDGPPGRFTCARKTIYNLSLSGAFEFTVLRSDCRVPDWSLQSFLRANVSERARNGELDFVKVGTLSRIPGWSILDHIERNCSEI